jgi:hypothetical protein
MSKQTAVQWLYNELSHCLHREEVCDLLYKLEQKAKKLEKQQIIEAFKHGELPPAFVNFDAKEYYNETYGGHSVDANEMIDHIAEVRKMVGGQDESDH